MRYDHSVLGALAEQFAFERQQRIAREQRAIKVAADNPDLSSEDLCERLSMTRDHLRRILPRGDMLRRYQESIAVLHPVAPGGQFHPGWRKRTNPPGESAQRAKKAQGGGK